MAVLKSQNIEKQNVIRKSGRIKQIVTISPRPRTVAFGQLQG